LRSAPSTPRSPVAHTLAAWAAALEPTREDLELAERALVDTVAVALAGHEHELLAIAEPLSAAGRLAVAAHVLDYDDLHLPSTSHVSAVCVPATLAAGGDARAYLVGAGIMARLGAQLGWSHYDAGWHTTCTAGAPAAAVAAGVAKGLDPERLATAIALALPAAGGAHRAFGTQAKPLQVGFAVEAGLRAAELAGAGATADVAALDQWLTLVHATEPEPVMDGPAVPGGLAVKLSPCCYALGRPIHAVGEALGNDRPEPDEIEAMLVSAPASMLRPLIHHRPESGLQGKFSLEYAVAASVLDGRPGFASFTDAAVARPAARRLLERVEIRERPGGVGLLSGTVRVELRTRSHGTRAAEVELPPGAPGRPATDAERASKLTDCAGGHAAAVAALRWDTAATDVPSLMSLRARA
jgi:2-methylcitrate dehydratase PrpD